MSGKKTNPNFPPQEEVKKLLVTQWVTLIECNEAIAYWIEKLGQTYFTMMTHEIQAIYIDSYWELSRKDNN